LLLGKGPTLPSVENCQSPLLPAAITSMIMITGLDDHDPLECMITIHRFEGSRSNGISDQDQPERACFS
jgi:hypothetical protein